MLYWLGLTSPNGGPYLWWSGFGACIRDFVALFMALRLNHHWHERWKRKQDDG